MRTQGPHLAGADPGPPLPGWDLLGVHQAGGGRGGDEGPGPGRQDLLGQDGLGHQGLHGLGVGQGHGGQGVNTTDSAVRITHLPTGLVVTCQDERSQLKNKARAMEVLRSRLFEMELRRQQDEVGSARKMQVGSGERGSKIRTYNFRENRVTDHRIGLTLYNLDRVLEGQLDPLLDALAEAGGREDGDET